MRRFVIVLMSCFFMVILSSFAAAEMSQIKVNGLARVNLLDDQRFQWSGLETTFFVEGQVALHIQKSRFSLDTNLFFNQRFDSGGILADEDHNKFISNFEIDTLELDTFAIRYHGKRATFTFGKFVTPFGKTYSPVLTNNRIITPFIRAEVINWRETGFMASFNRGIFSLDLGIVNGGEDRDTNSSKATIARLGAGKSGSWEVGISEKIQDGVGSESQKQFNSHIGLDAMYRSGPMTVSGEIIYDKFGNKKRPGEAVYSNIYGRDLNAGVGENPYGIGWYLDLLYTSGKWKFDLNYGEFTVVKKTGFPVVDAPNKRGIIQAIYSVTENVQTHMAVMIENDRPKEEWQSGASPYAVLIGLQYNF